MKTIFICPYTGRCGGLRVLAELCSRLPAEWWGVDPHPQSWFNRSVAYRQFPTLNALYSELAQTGPKVAIATWWETAAMVHQSLRPGDRGFYFIQDEDELTYSGQEGGSSYKLGLTPIFSGDFVKNEMARKYGLSGIQIGQGCDFDRFKPLNVPKDHNRIFTGYRPGFNDLKGWDKALATVKLVCQQNPKASLVTFGSVGAPPPQTFPHIHVHAPTDEKLRELYSQAGCYLMTSKHEGFCLPALEAMACGCPVVCTDAHGNREFCLDGATCLAGTTPEELADKVLHFQRHAELRERITAKALEYVRGNYQWDNVISRLAKALSVEESAPALAVFTSKPAIQWISCRRLIQDTLDKLLSKLSSDIDGIVGVPRSGMMPAAALAAVLHLPLYTISNTREFDGIILCYLDGSRSPTPKGVKLLLVEDAVTHGSQLEKLGKRFNLLTAATYIHPTAVQPDFFGEILDHPHLFEWNIMNSSVAPGCHYHPLVEYGVASDLDGVICQNPPNERQLKLPARLFPLRSIITSRPADQRAATEAWLAKCGIQYTDLIIGLTNGDAAAWKAEQYARRQERIYLESEPDIAKQISEMSGKCVICPTTEEVFA